MQLNITESAGNSTVSIVYDEHNASSPHGSARVFTSPLSAADLADLRFYLEYYAQLAEGENGARGERVEKEKLDLWGEALYGALFTCPERIAAYDRIRIAAARSGPVEVLVRSNDPAFLGLPWELLKAPGESEPLSVRVSCFDRSLLLQEPARSFPAIDDGFRVLMVIARPEGIQDVPFQAVARQLLERLEGHDGPVKVEVLRPPTFAAFRQTLLRARRNGHPYHTVHFDGHGAFYLLQGNGAPPKGVLLFEQEAGGEEIVSAQDFASTVRDGGVPLVILNACQSATFNTGDGTATPEASIATRLLQEGAASVIAMSHKVYVVAATAFMGTFYEELLAGRSVGEAVNLGRKALRVRQNGLIAGLKGPMKLQDWMVPVHYVRSNLMPLAADRPQLAVMDEVAQIFAKPDCTNSDTDRLAADGGVFFGRDSTFFALERAVRTRRVAVIYGEEGIGKTELAKAFARWFIRSGGVDHPELVFFHPFKPGLASFGLDRVLDDIFEQLRQTVDLDTRSRAALVLKMLTRFRCLLIWDNFETVASTPNPSQVASPLDGAKLEELAWFINKVKTTKSALLITSRSDEAWLGGLDSLVRLELGGLDKADALCYADHLLAPHEAAIARRQKEPQSFKALLTHLGGNPLSLRLVLPDLARESPATLLAGLRSLCDVRQPPNASILYSFRHLPQADQQRLVILSLFEQVASALILGTLSDPPQRCAGLDIQAWDALLARLAGRGLLTNLGGGVYRMPPSLPPFLTELWREQAGDSYAAERQQALSGLIVSEGDSRKR